MRILTVNPGSSSLKLSLLEDDDSVVSRAEAATEDTGDEGEQLAAALERMPRPDAVGLRFVHGGRDFTEPVVIDDRVAKRLEELVDLAPLHQPLSLYALDQLVRALPGVPVVGCFDTAFHARLPEAAATYALPAAWRERYGLRRYGFHGLSYAYAVRRIGDLLNTDTARLRMVICHLGSGASLAAVRGKSSIDTTMGFTPLEGLVMGSRAGNVDPGIPLWLIRHGLAADEVADALDHQSGLRGLAGTSDMRELRARGDEEAKLALDVYHHRLRACAAAMVAALGGVDVLAFTGGVGEHDPATRSRLGADLDFLGVAIDPEANKAAEGETEITAPGAAVRTLVIDAREDLEIAAGVRSALSASRGT